MSQASHPENKASLEIWFIFPLNYFEDAFIDSVSLDASVPTFRLSIQGPYLMNLRFSRLVCILVSWFT